MNYRNAKEMHKIHYEEIFSRKEEILKFLKLETVEIKNSNYFITKRQGQSIFMPPGIDLIFKKKTNMKFNGFYLIYDEELE